MAPAAQRPRQPRLRQQLQRLLLLPLAAAGFPADGAGPAAAAEGACPFARGGEGEGDSAGLLQVEHRRKEDFPSDEEAAGDAAAAPPQKPPGWLQEWLEAQGGSLRHHSGWHGGREPPSLLSAGPQAACPSSFPALEELLGEGPGHTWALFNVPRIALERPCDGCRLLLTAEVVPGGLFYETEKVNVTGKVVTPDFHFLVPVAGPSPATEVNVKLISRGHVYDSELASLQQPLAGARLGSPRPGGRGGAVTVRLLSGQEMAQELGSIKFRQAHEILLPKSGLWGSLTTSSWTAAQEKLGFWAGQVPNAIGFLFFSTLGANTMVGGVQKVAYGRSKEDTCDQGNLGKVSGGVQILSVAYAKRYLKNFGDRVRTFNTFRRHELCPWPLNYGWWPEKANRAIGLGDNPIDHGFVRPWLDKLWGPEVAKSDTVRTMVASFAASSWETHEGKPRASFETDDSRLYSQILLHKIGLSIDLSMEDAKDIQARQMAIVMRNILPNELDVGGILSAYLGHSVELPWSRWLGQRFTPDHTQWKAAKMEGFKAALIQKFGRAVAGLSGYEQTLLAAAALDSLIWAGGLSVASTLQNSMTLLYGTYGKARLKQQFPNGFNITEDNVDQFIYETIRTFPPVSGFGGWDARTNTHIWVDLFYVNGDREAWGEDAGEFRLRPLKDYQDKMVAWVNPALVNGDNGNPYSQKCPGFHLSMLLMREFLLAFQRAGGSACWEPTEQESNITSSSIVPASLTLRRMC